MARTTKTIRFEKPEGDLALEKCPFCGSQNVYYEEYETVVGNRWRVVCLDCMANVDPGWAQQRVAVRDMWNRRAE